MKKILLILLAAGLLFGCSAKVEKTKETLDIGKCYFDNGKVFKVLKNHGHDTFGIIDNHGDKSILIVNHYPVKEISCVLIDGEK